jgi:hypothetical protein
MSPRYRQTEEVVHMAEMPPKHTSNPVLLVPAFAVLAAAVVLAVRASAPWWFVLAGLVGPDLTFVFAIGAPKTAPRLVPRRVVVPYNLLHRPVPPVLMLVASAVLQSAPLAVVAISWVTHILMDRGVGFGLRDHNGAIIPPKRFNERQEATHRKPPSTTVPLENMTSPRSGRACSAGD